MNLPSSVPLNWLGRAKIHVTPVDDEVVSGEQKTIDLYLRAGLIKQKLNAADIVDRSFSKAIGRARASESLCYLKSQFFCVNGAAHHVGSWPGAELNLSAPGVSACRTKKRKMVSVLELTRKVVKPGPLVD